MRYFSHIIAILTLIASPAFAEFSGQFRRANAFYLAEDYADALALLNPLAETGDADAQTLLGFMYERGLGLDVDNQAALMWYLRGIEGGSSMAASNLGVVFRDGLLEQSVDAQRSAGYFRAAIDMGDTSSYADLALLYGTGALGAPNQDEALRLFQTGIDLGDMRVKLQLAYARRHGDAVPQDYAIARQLLTELAADGNGEALGNLAVMMELGEGAPVDLDEAAATYEAAMHLGYVEAAYWAAWMYADNPDHFADPVRGEAYCLWAMGHGSQGQVQEWEPKCADWFGDHSTDQHKAARHLAATL